MAAADTIYALASAKGQAGVAVVRVSGARAFDSLRAFTTIQDIPFRKAILRELKRPVSRETLDQAVILAFQNPQSYTGEDVVEYHLHGGMAVIYGVINALSELEGYRMAEPGEFTRRAFENGKMDLTEAEAVADLIHAETALQKDQALLQMGGALTEVYENWRDRLIKLLAYVEAELEFPDEDLEIDVVSEIRPKIDALNQNMDEHLNDNRRGERLRNGIHVAVIGAPNAGKSSLVNALVQRDVAIVSEIAGTTRDVIEAHLDIGGYPVILSDTAGLRPDQIGEQGQDSIESEGIRRALQIAENADIRVILYDGTSEILDPHSIALEKKLYTISAINKADEGLVLSHPDNPLQISVKSGSGISEFLDLLTRMIDNLIGQSSAPALTRERHREALVDCRASLDRCLNVSLPELAAEDLRLAVRHLGRITGKVDVEDLLDVVFKDFCIGK